MRDSKGFADPTGSGEVPSLAEGTQPSPGSSPHLCAHWAPATGPLPAMGPFLPLPSAPLGSQPGFLLFRDQPTTQEDTNVPLTPSWPRLLPSLCRNNCPLCPLGGLPCLVGLPSCQCLQEALLDHPHQDHFLKGDECQVSSRQWAQRKNPASFLLSEHTEHPTLLLAPGLVLQRQSLRSWATQALRGSVSKVRHLALAVWLSG